MKQLNYIELENINGGGFLDGFCAAVGAVGAGVTIAVIAGATIATGGVAGVVAGVAVGGCAAYGIYLLN
jgi:hydrogenase maturation factor HypE